MGPQKASVWFLAVFGGYLFTRSGESGQASTDCSDFRRCFYGFQSAVSGRSKRSAACHPKLPKVRTARGALLLPEGAKRVSRAAARLYERPRSLPTRATAPAGPENQGGSLFLARPVAAPAGRACRPAGDRRARRASRLGRQGQFFSEREPNIGLLWGAGCLNKRPTGPVEEARRRRTLRPPSREPFPAPAGSRIVASRFPEALSR
jgi:hypothetical protein